ncbi:N-acetylmuramoyl-L-alanine amidase [Dysgonomonas sp. 25]|uniref:N-acetylmuramoyl-L-alanine amidase family protein n=1 Tax=Dysgonomonas sp. 25 TaxID=2302933 RepID=UPI0013D1CC2E|nr:N-acetylmuramoyl-L-alanine amidase [Dysgonomonas sp. 25]NDV68165.1 N-acetylmuramoyl-L-alanine amidase [Dysgonomonas sp. 25]
MKRAFLLLCSILFLYGFVYPDNSKFVVVIDAGHGGRDPGAVRGKVKEKDINLAVALELGNLIKRNMSDVKVVYTRDKDVFVELADRAKKANKEKANLFISVHTNSTDAKKTTASGADTYILGLARSAENLAVAKRENAVILLEEDYSVKYESFDPNSTESYIIFEFMTNKYMEQSLNVATHIQDKFRTKAKRADRGVRQAGFLVLRNTSMPSILIELGFINNATEATYLASKNGQKVMAESIYEGFKKYKEDFDKRDSKSKPVEVPAISVSEPVAVVDVLPAIADQVEYRIQFMYSPKKLPGNSSEFKGLSPVDSYYENGYKYTYGSTTNYDEIQKQLKEVKTKFKDAFVIRFKDGKRVK